MACVRRLSDRFNNLRIRLGALPCPYFTRHVFCNLGLRHDLTHGFYPRHHGIEIIRVRKETRVDTRVIQRIGACQTHGSQRFGTLQIDIDLNAGFGHLSAAHQKVAAQSLH